MGAHGSCACVQVTVIFLLCGNVQALFEDIISKATLVVVMPWVVRMIMLMLIMPVVVIQSKAALKTTRQHPWWQASRSAAPLLTRCVAQP